jgi:hypothetical protein
MSTDRIIRNRIERLPMPSESTDVSTETPKRVRHSFDKIVGRLNTQWSLDIPSLHGSQENALDQADAIHSLAKRCGGMIRYLCFRDCRLDKVISDFEDDVRRIRSDWVWKPLQEEGTLPRMPITKSFISTRPPLPRKHRQPLLVRLFELLDEEFKLARQSEVYRRTSFTTSNVTAGGSLQNETNVTTSVTVAGTEASEAAARQSPQVPVAETRKAKSQSSSSREIMKRRSSGSEKVRSNHN